MAVYGPPGNEELYQYGIKRRSGRYPYGSGENPYQRLKVAVSRNKENMKDMTIGEKRRMIKADMKKQKIAIERKKAKEKAQKKAAKEAETQKAKEEEAKKAEAEKPASEKVKTMSDEEIYAAINRLRLEQTYLSLLDPKQQSSSSQNGSQNKQQQQNNQQKQQQPTNNINKGKSWLEKSVDLSKKVGDLSTNVGNIAKGANAMYSNIAAIKKAVEKAQKEANKK